MLTVGANYQQAVMQNEICLESGASDFRFPFQGKMVMEL